MHHLCPFSIDRYSVILLHYLQGRLKNMIYPCGLEREISNTYICYGQFDLPTLMWKYWLKNIKCFKKWQVYFEVDTPSLYMILSASQSLILNQLE